MVRYLRLVRSYARISFQRQTSDRVSFILAVVGKTLRMGLLIVYWAVVFQTVPRIGEWDFDRSLAFVAFYLTLENLAVMTFHRNLLYYFPALIRKGEFDLILTRPSAPLFSVSFRLLDVMDTVSGLVPLTLWAVIFARQPELLTWINLVKITAFLALGYCFLFAITVLVSASMFVAMTRTGAGRAFEGIIRINRFPLDFLPPVLQTAFTYVIPIALIATVPAKAIFGLPVLPALLGGVSATILLSAIAYAAWQKGLKRYASASS